MLPARSPVLPDLDDAVAGGGGEEGDVGLGHRAHQRQAAEGSEERGRGESKRSFLKQDLCSPSLRWGGGTIQGLKDFGPERELSLGSKVKKKTVWAIGPTVSGCWGGMIVAGKWEGGGKPR